MSIWTLSPLVLFVGIQLTVAGQQTIYTGKSGTAVFRSDTKLEIIHATSSTLSGAVNTEAQGVAFTVRINSFEGFNNPVQQVHFMENFMEATRYPVATFTGKIIEEVRFDTPGIHHIRVKGILNVHGVDSERIIPGTLTVETDQVHVQSRFMIRLEEHNINVPKLFSQKIAEFIAVQIDVHLEKT
jgi:polyisoprenoid-binding protein YceI